jgi:hypothetical protein
MLDSCILWSRNGRLKTFNPTGTILIDTIIHRDDRWSLMALITMRLSELANGHLKEVSCFAMCWTVTDVTEWWYFQLYRQQVLAVLGSHAKRRVYSSAQLISDRRRFNSKYWKLFQRNCALQVILWHVLKYRRFKQRPFFNYIANF